MELDIAIVKATTSQFHVQPKEKHVRTLKGAVTPAQPRRQVTYIISEVVKRMKEASDWLTVLKCLITIHRLMRESDLSFLEELLKYSEEVTRGKTRQVLNVDNFIDTSNSEGRFEFSEWVRAYGKYLDEQLEVYNQISWYQEGESKMRTLGGKEMLSQLPLLQHLLQRLVDCKPTGQATHDPVVQASLLLVLTESFRLYKAISEGLINLADRFFEMEYLEAQKGLEVYKETLVANQRLQEYYQAIEGIEDMRRAIQFPKLEPPPLDFLHQMEDYCREAPRPLDPKHPGPKAKSPPLRKGRNAGPTQKREKAQLDTSSAGDPGMVLPASQATSQPAPEPQQPDLLDLGDLSIGDSTSNGNNGATSAPPASNGGGSTGLDFLSEPQPAHHKEATADPFAAGSSFGGNNFGQQPSNAHSTGTSSFGQPGAPSQQQHSNGGFGHQQQQPQYNAGGFPSAAGGASTNPFNSAPQSGFGGQNTGGQSHMGGGFQGQHQGPPSFQQGPSSIQQGAPSFQQGGAGGFQQGGSSFQQGGAGNFQQGGAGGFPAASAAPSAAPGSNTMPAFAAGGPRNTTGPALKKAAAADDPFGDLTGLKPSNVPKVQPSLKAQGVGGGPAVQGQSGAPAASSGFSAGGGFGAPSYPQQQSFNPSSFDQDTGFGGGAFGGAPKPASPAKASSNGNNSLI
ncbi:hypothetical protein WJX73_000925 [Symbiochloris irregularis]|uniref:ENTH domain-containing protein n=2 Tax=Symbiochloris irregularis TaxID=706552 RepID=A0AAW1PTL0_9CHLO